MIKFCKICLSLDTSFTNKINKKDICFGCINFENKKLINWNLRRKLFIKLIKVKNINNKKKYNCIVPVSGGKDSTYQLMKIKEYGGNPLGICIDTGHLTEIGKLNLENLKKKNDILHYSVDKNLTNKLARIGLIEFGNPAWVESFLINTVILNISLSLNIYTIFWGENSSEENGGPIKWAKSRYLTNDVVAFWSKSFFNKINYLKKKYKLNLNNFLFSCPAKSKLNLLKPYYMSFFFSWDGFKNYEYAKKYGFRSFDDRVSGTILNYERIDNYHDGINDYLKYLKTGMGRAHDQVSRMLRRGYISKKKGIDMINRYDGEYPSNYAGKKIKEILGELEISKEMFDKVCKKYLNKKIFFLNKENDSKFFSKH